MHGETLYAKMAVVCTCPASSGAVAPIIFAGPTRSRFLRHLESIFNQEGRTSNWSGTSSIDWKTLTTNEEWHVFKLYCNFGTPSLFNVVSVFCLAVSAGVVMP